jgi:hypothetical protein
LSLAAQRRLLSNKFYEHKYWQNHGYRIVIKRSGNQSSVQSNRAPKSLCQGSKLREKAGISFTGFPERIIENTQEVNHYKHIALRSVADLDNYRRRVAAKKIQAAGLDARGRFETMPCGVPALDLSLDDVEDALGKLSVAALAALRRECIKSIARQQRIIAAIDSGAGG